jgi:hypothetical protein
MASNRVDPFKIQIQHLACVAAVHETGIRTYPDAVQNEGQT